MDQGTTRLQRLEENLAFAEHTIEQLSAELAQINLRLAEALRRIDRLERRLDRIAAGPAPAETHEFPDTPEPPAHLD